MLFFFYIFLRTKSFYIFPSHVLFCISYSLWSFCTSWIKFSSLYKQWNPKCFTQQHNWLQFSLIRSLTWSSYSKMNCVYPQCKILNSANKLNPTLQRVWSNWEDDDIHTSTIMWSLSDCGLLLRLACMYWGK